MEEINMKTWNTPEVKELNINETANGIFNSEFESLIIFNDKKSDTPDTDNTDDPIDMQS